MRHIKKHAYELWQSDINTTLCEVSENILSNIPHFAQVTNTTQLGGKYRHAFIYESKGEFSLSILWTDNELDNILVEIFYTRDLQSVIDYYKIKKQNNLAAS